MQLIVFKIVTDIAHSPKNMVLFEDLIVVHTSIFIFFAYGKSQVRAKLHSECLQM